MKYLFAVLALALAPAVTTLFGCASGTNDFGVVPKSEVVAPKGATQTIYAVEVSLTIAVNALADLHSAGVVTGDNYAKAVAIEKQAHATLLLARNAVLAKAEDKAQVYLTTLSGLIDQIAIYNGGKK